MKNPEIITLIRYQQPLLPKMNKMFHLFKKKYINCDIREDFIYFSIYFYDKKTFKKFKEIFM